MGTIRPGCAPRRILLAPPKPRRALMRFVELLGAIFRLVAAWKLFGHLETPPGTNRLIAGLMVTTTLNLWNGTGFLAFGFLHRQVNVLP